MARSAAFLAAYAATKAFGVSLAERLSVELAPTVDVVTCLAGPTVTPTFDKLDAPSFPPPRRGDLAAESTLEALGRTAVVVPGLLNRVIARLVVLLQRRRLLSMVVAQTQRYSLRNGGS